MSYGCIESESSPQYSKFPVYCLLSSLPLPLGSNFRDRSLLTFPINPLIQHRHTRIEMQFPRFPARIYRDSKSLKVPKRLSGRILPHLQVPQRLTRIDIRVFHGRPRSEHAAPQVLQLVLLPTRQMLRELDEHLNVLYWRTINRKHY